MPLADGGPHDDAVIDRPDPAALQTRAILFDFDGVLRFWEDIGLHAAEQVAGLADGVMKRLAFGDDSYKLACLGYCTHWDWVHVVRRRLAGLVGTEVAAEAIAVWQADRGMLNSALAEILACASEQARIGILSNCTDMLQHDVRHFGLDQCVDVVLTSATLRVGKPARPAFQASLRALNAHPADVLFVDDLTINVKAAALLGMHTVRYRGPASIGDVAAHVRLPSPE